MLTYGRILLTAIAMLVAARPDSAHVVDPNKFSPHDFATEVVYYEPGDDVHAAGAPYDFFWRRYYDRYEAAIGAPTRCVRMGDGLPEYVNPILPPYDANDIVSVGTTADPCNPAAIVVKFDHNVCHDSRNPYGMDFIVFGNARFFPADLNGQWQRGDNASLRFIGSAIYEEPGLVSVSQTGLPGSWHTYASPIYRRADAFAPTAARRWNMAIGGWGEWLDPTHPIDPNLKPSDFYGKSVAEAIEMYNGSAGGAAFDISVFGLAWIRYVKIEQDPDNPYVLEVDAVSDVAAAGDLNYDCRVDLRDFAIIASRWGGDYGELVPLVQNWLVDTGEAE